MPNGSLANSLQVSGSLLADFTNCRFYGGIISKQKGTEI